MRFRSGEALTESSGTRGAPLESKDGTAPQPLTRFPREKLQKLSGEKKCRKCGKEKPVSQFPRNARTLDRLSSWCKRCHAKGVVKCRDRQRKRARERQWREQLENNRRLGEQDWVRRRSA